MVDILGRNPIEELDFSNLEQNTLLVKAANQKAIRVITDMEALKFTKASHQFIMRFMRLGLVPTEILEQIITQLLFSDSRFVTLQETKWAIRESLAEQLDTEQLAFLDLVLYQKEDDHPLH